MVLSFTPNAVFWGLLHLFSISFFQQKILTQQKFLQLHQHQRSYNSLKDMTSAFADSALSTELREHETGLGVQEHFPVLNCYSPWVTAKIKSLTFCMQHLAIREVYVGSKLEDGIALALLMQICIPESTALFEVLLQLNMCRIPPQPFAFYVCSYVGIGPI